MITIYHNPRCKKSRAGLEYLRQQGHEFRIVEYFKHPLKENELVDLLIKLNKRPHEIIRTQESLFKKNFKGKNFEDHEWIRILIEYPQLLQRPIVVKKYRAVIGDPVDNIANLVGG